jgi:hypothetical protein
MGDRVRLVAYGCLSPSIGMSPGEFTAGIGLTYLMIPIIATGIGAGMTRAARPAA